MAASRLDTAARSPAAASSRRRLLGAASGGLAALIGALRPVPAAASCRKLGRTCQTNGACCRGATCIDQRCRCRRHWDTCGTDKCFPLLLDPRNCGAGGNVCLLGAICQDGTCV